MSTELTEFASDDSKVIDIINPQTVFDIERFDQVMRVAEVMARASIIPQHLKIMTDNRFDFEATRGNCFVIANLAANWGLDPFQVAQASAMVFGKIVLEGKLVRAVIRKFLGFDLNYAYFGGANDADRRVYVSDKALLKQINGNSVAMTEDEVRAAMDSPDFRVTTGTFKAWATKQKDGSTNDNWSKDERKMFRERGSREWCREFAPGLMLGIYTPDEFDEMDTASRSNRARDISPSNRNPLLDDKRSVPMDKIDSNTGEVVSQQSNTKQQTGKQNQSTRASGGAGGSEGGSQENAGTRFTDAVFEEFSTALLRYSTDSLKKASDKFWGDRGGYPADAGEFELGRAIFELHKSRAAGEINAEEAKTKASSLIANFFKL